MQISRHRAGECSIKRFHMSGRAHLPARFERFWSWWWPVWYKSVNVEAYHYSNNLNLVEQLTFTSDSLTNAHRRFDFILFCSSCKSAWPNEAEYLTHGRHSHHHALSIHTAPQPCIAESSHFPFCATHTTPHHQLLASGKITTSIPVLTYRIRE